MKACIILGVLAAWSACALGQCSNGRCIVRPAQAPAPEPEACWKIWPSNPGQAFLYRGDQCVGVWDLSGSWYRTWERSSWGAQASPPVAVPSAQVSYQQKEEQLPTGVDWSKLRKSESCSIDGRQITVRELLNAWHQLPGPFWPDDSRQRILTAVGKDAATTARMRSDLVQPALADVVKPFRVQTYDLSRKVDQIILEPFKLAADGRFQSGGEAWLVQEPSSTGKAKVVLAVYGKKPLPELADELQKAHPDYVPPRPSPPIPGPKGPEPAPHPSTAGHDHSPFALVMLIGAGCAATLTWRYKRRAQL